MENWRARIIAKIRAPAAGGSQADYETWGADAGASYINVVKGWLGLGTVGIIVAMSGPNGPVAPTDAQIAQIQTYIDQYRPVRGNAVVVAATIVPQNVTISLNPDTANARTQVQAAVAAYYATQNIGGMLYVSQLSDAISSVSGETSHVISVPSADQQLANNQLPVLGTITWGNVA